MVLDNKESIIEFFFVFFVLSFFINVFIFIFLYLFQEICHIRSKLIIIFNQITGSSAMVEALLSVEVASCAGAVTVA